MGKAAFVSATRHARAVVVMAATNRIDFTAPIGGGDMVELVFRVKMTGRSSLLVEVELCSADQMSPGVPQSRQAVPRVTNADRSTAWAIAS
jgi:acyl-CoA hydrolase